MDMVYKLIIVGIAVGLLTGALFKIHHDIYQSGVAACQGKYAAEQATANTKIVETKKVIKHETSSLDRNSIVDQLCRAGWVRDRADCPAK